MTQTYKIIRFFQSDAITQKKPVKTGLTLEEARAHCQDPESDSATCTKPAGVARTGRCGPWFDGYTKE